MKDSRFKQIGILFLIMAIVFVGIVIVINSRSSAACEKYAKQMYAIDFEIREDEDIDIYILDSFMSTYVDSLQRCSDKSKISYKDLYKIVLDTRNEMIKKSNGLRKVPMQSVLQYLDKNLQKQPDSVKLSKREVTEICQLYFTKHIWDVDEWKDND
jgi:hypothetical protein